MYQIKDRIYNDKIMRFLSKYKLPPSDKLIEEYKSSDIKNKLDLPLLEHLSIKIDIKEETYNELSKTLQLMKTNNLFYAKNIQIQEVVIRDNETSWIYTGQCRNNSDIKEGLGTLISSNGDFYKCYWKNDLPCYQGIFISSNKGKYEGTFEIPKTQPPSEGSEENSSEIKEINLGVTGSYFSGNSWLIERYISKDIPKFNIFTEGVNILKTGYIDDNLGYFKYVLLNKDKFLECHKNIGEVKELITKDIPLMLIGSKLDLIEEREVQYNEGKEFADKNGMQFYEVSAKTGENVEQAFNHMIELILSSNVFINKDRYTNLKKKDVEQIIKANEKMYGYFNWFL